MLHASTEEVGAGPDPAAGVDAIQVDGREFVLVGTAHVSRESAELARRVIERERPDCVCIELDARRYEALLHRQAFEALDLKEIIRRRQLTTLLVNLVLSSYQQQLGQQLGVVPGSEFVEAAEAAKLQGIPLVLCDRDVRITLRRAWGSLSAWQKLKLFGSLLHSLIERPELDEEAVRQLRRQDVGSQLIEELGADLPALKGALIDERDVYLAEKIRQAPGARVVAVIGAGHLGGIRRVLQEPAQVDMNALETVPPLSTAWKWIGWSIPVLILGCIAAIGWRHGLPAAGDSAVFWILVNGLPSLAGAILALAHPLVVLIALVAAPFTSLTPLIGVGYVAAFAQAYLRPPRVYELSRLATDARRPASWWRNRALRILLVFLLTSLGSSMGTIVGGVKIVANLF